MICIIVIVNNVLWNIITSSIILYCKLLEVQIAFQCSVESFYNRWFFFVLCAVKCHSVLTMVFPSLIFYRDYLWILLNTTIIANNYFLSLFHFDYLCMSTRSAVQVLFIAYFFVTFEWYYWRLQKDSTNLWIVLK